MRSLLQSHGLMDAWREHYTCDFTFYSNPRDSFCRIDHVFIPLRTISSIHKRIIPASPWSDHDPIVFFLALTGLTCPIYQWRLNDSLLTSQDAFLDIHSHLIKKKNSDNVGSVTSAISLWETHKATMRGHFIQLASSRKQEREKKIQELTSRLASATI